MLRFSFSPLPTTALALVSTTATSILCCSSNVKHARFMGSPKRRETSCQGTGVLAWSGILMRCCSTPADQQGGHRYVDAVRTRPVQQNTELEGIKIVWFCCIHVWSSTASSQ